MSKALKIAILVSVLCVALLIGLTVYGIVGIVNKTQEEEERFRQALEHLDSLDLQGDVAYLCDGVLYLQGVALEIPYEYEFLGVGKDSVYLLAEDAERTVKQILRTDYKLENEAVILEIPSKNSVYMVDPQTILYHYGNTVRIYHTDTQRTDTYTDVYYWDMYHALKNDTPYLIFREDDFFVIENTQTDDRFTVPVENSPLNEDTHAKKICALLDEEAEIETMYIDGNTVYADVVLDSNMGGSLLLTYSYDLSSATFTLVSYCAVDYYFDYEAFPIK